MGTAGSRGVINRGVYASVGLANATVQKHYFDIVNLDRYNAIIGTVGMKKLGIILDLPRDKILIQGREWDALSEGEERTIMARRQAMRIQRKANQE